MQDIEVLTIGETGWENERHRNEDDTRPLTSFTYKVALAQLCG